MRPSAEMSGYALAQTGGGENVSSHSSFQSKDVPTCDNNNNDKTNYNNNDKTNYNYNNNNNNNNNTRARTGRRG